MTIVSTTIASSMMKSSRKDPFENVLELLCPQTIHIPVDGRVHGLKDLDVDGDDVDIRVTVFDGVAIEEYQDEEKR